MHSCNASQHLHLYLCNQSLTPFICIHSLHNYKIYKIFLMHIHSMLPCIDSGILCIQHTMHGLTMPTSYRMHYYNQDHQYLLSSINIYRHGTFLYSNIHMVWGLLPLPIHGICHKQTLTCMGLTYTLSMTNLVGPCRRLQNLLTNFCYGLVALSLLHRVVGLIFQHPQHIHPGPCHRWCFH